MSKRNRRLAWGISCLLLLGLMGCSPQAESSVAEQSDTPAETAGEEGAKAESAGEDAGKAEGGTSEGGLNIESVSGTLRMATTALSSNGQILGSAMCSVVSGHLTNLKTSVIISAGSGENAFLIADGEAELCIMTPDVAYAARNGMEPYGKIDLYAVCKTFTNQTVFCVRKDSGITKMEDLEGKRVAVGATGSGPYELAKAVLESGYGLWDKIEPVYMNTADSPDALRDGTVDAMVAHLSSYYPASYLAELDASSVEVKYLGVSEDAMARIKESLPFEIATELQASDSRLTQLDEDLISMSNTQFVGARTDVPEEQVYAFTKALFENAEEMDSYHALGATIRAENALEGVDPGVPVHPGAARYYKEIGVWDDSFTIGVIQ